MLFSYMETSYGEFTNSMKTSDINVKFHNSVFYSLFVSYQPIYLAKSECYKYLSSINRLTYNAFHCYILKIDDIFQDLRVSGDSIYPYYSSHEIFLKYLCTMILERS